MDKQAIYSVKELNRQIKRILEHDSRVQDVWVKGEISNYTHHSSGHMYFTLKDKDSRLKCIMFASYNQRLPFIPREGTKVIARGSISVYERDGQYQFYITQMQPDGVGSLYLAYEQLKSKLEQEGLFSPQFKKPIPQYPKAIGVITSPTGAAVRDIIITLRRRYPAVPIIIYPVLVQGSQAAPAIVRAIDVMCQLQEVDVMIVGRGGGSLEELWAFNEEAVARAIHRATIPIISAVGHETDFTIADFVADLRAATPTAAAELAVPHRQELKQQVQQLAGRLQRGLLGQVEERRMRLKRLQRSPVLLYPERQLIQPMERLDRLKEQLHYRMISHFRGAREHKQRIEQTLLRYNPREQARKGRMQADAMRQRLFSTMTGLAKESRQQWLSQLRHLDALSPLKVMQRGYSLVYDEAGTRLLQSIKQVQPGDIVNIAMTDGKLQCHVWSMEENINDK